MIWGLCIALSLAVSLYLLAPFLTKTVKPSNADEVSTYREELKSFEQNEDFDLAKKSILQDRLLKAAKRQDPIENTRSFALPTLITLITVGASLGIYAAIGSPNFTPETRQAAPTLADSSLQEYETLLPKFEAALAENPDDAKGWQYYGRTLMLSGRLDAGLRAYERALELNDTPELQKEFEAARKFASQTQSGPNAEDIAAMQSLSREEQSSAIEGMVESLRMKLEDDPSDVQGWVRLLRSRKVLGQTEAAKADMDFLRQKLPDEADNIILQSGWTD